MRPLKLRRRLHLVLAIDEAPPHDEPLHQPRNVLGGEQSGRYHLLQLAKELGLLLQLPGSTQPLQLLDIADGQAHHQVHQHDAGEDDEQQENDAWQRRGVPTVAEQVGVFELAHHHDCGLDKRPPGVGELLVTAELDGEAQGEAYYQAEEGQQHLERGEVDDTALFNGRSPGYLKFGNDVWGLFMTPGIHPFIFTTSTTR